MKNLCFFSLALFVATISPLRAQNLAVVDGVPVTRAQLGEFLEAQSGEQTLPYLIDLQLILGELKRRNLGVSEAEIDADLKSKIERDASFADLLKNSLRFKAVRQQIRRDLAMQKLLASEISPPGEAQLLAFWKTHQHFYAQPAQIRVGILLSSSAQRAAQMERALKTSNPRWRRTFAQLVAEQQRSKDSARFINSNDSEEWMTLDQFDGQLREVFAALPQGGISNVQLIPVVPGENTYGIFRKIDFRPEVRPSLFSIRSQVVTDFRLAQIAKREVKKNPANRSWEKSVEAVQIQLRESQPSQRPALRDILTFILRPASENLLAKLKTESRVQIESSDYSQLKSQYQ